MTNELRHGTWWDRLRDVALREAMEGRFTRLFDADPKPPYNQEDLRKLAAAMTAKPDIPPTPETKTDPEENSAVPAAYTYLGQFIDHDLTLDLTSSLREKLTPDQLHKLADFRTPRFDLDNLYGRGPDEEPYLYQADGVRLLLGSPLAGNDRDPDAADLPRGPSGRALIGDPRNDENPSSPSCTRPCCASTTSSPGQRVARALGEQPLADAEIKIGKGSETSADQGQPITEISTRFAGHTPLWPYVLAEAWQTSWHAVPSPDNATPIRLGPVGGRLVAGTFAALLVGDRRSVVYAKDFAPLISLSKPDGTFGLAELINAALGRKP